MRTLAFVSFIGLAAAQSTSLFNFTFDVGLVDPVERSNWCSGERNTCQALCPGAPKENACEPDDLSFACTCNNGSAPGLQYYDQSLYSFVCRESFNQCNENNAGDAAELKKCVSDIRDTCGTLTIKDVEPATTSGSSGGSGDATATADSSGSSSSSGIAPTAFPGKGAAVLAIGLAAAFV